MFIFWLLVSPLIYIITLTSWSTLLLLSIALEWLLLACCMPLYKPSVFCFLTNGESNSTDILWKSQLKGYSLCTIATQVSATVCLRTRASFLSWTLSSGCCKYRLTLAGVYVDAFLTILIKNAEYSLVVWHNIMVHSFFNGDCTTQWGITLLQCSSTLDLSLFMGASDIQ